MKTKKLLLTSAIVAVLGGLYGCSEGDDSTVNIEDNSTSTSGGSSSSSISQNCPSWASAKEMDAEGNDVCALPSTISESRTLTNDIVWYMEDRVTVGNGNGIMSPIEGVLESGADVLDVTLTIEAGTEVKAKSGTFANLLITRGSQIEAVGTADAPIVFSSDDDGYEGAGEWGGLIIHGYGLHNDADYDCDAGPASCQNVDSEGESGFAGGSTADDSSGTLQYVVVTEGGYEFAPGNEINGVSFVAVGSGTTVDYLQVNSNADDGVEFYGGAVNAKHLVLTGNLDDSVDWDEGYTGNLQYVLVKQTAAGGNTVEADTEGSTDFLSAPTIVNATFLGFTGTDGKPTLHVLKKSSAGFFHNAVMSGVDADGVYQTIDNCVEIDGSGAQDNVDGTNNGGANPGLTINTVYNNVVANCTNFEVDGSEAVQTTINDAGASTFTVVDAAIDADYASQAAAAAGLASIDWAAFNVAHPESTADASFLEDTDYAGAVDPAGNDDWFSAWIVEGSL